MKRFFAWLFSLVNKPRTLSNGYSPLANIMIEVMDENARENKRIAEKYFTPKKLEKYFKTTLQRICFNANEHTCSIVYADLKLPEEHFVMFANILLAVCKELNIEKAIGVNKNYVSIKPDQFLVAYAKYHQEIDVNEKARMMLHASGVYR